MTSPQDDPMTRLDELLADDAVQGLEHAEMVERDDLLSRWPGVDPAGFERAAAAADLAFGPTNFEPLPAHLRSKLLANADHFFHPVTPSRGAKRMLRAVSWSGWVAAAACAFLLVRPWEERDPGRRRQQLLAQPSGVVNVACQGRDRTAGDVTWSNARQEGYLRLEGLPANDPLRLQYQLWIYDAERRGPPVDGGVFDVPFGDGPVVVPIRPRLPVFSPRKFAVTRVAPGGEVIPEEVEPVLSGTLP